MKKPESITECACHVQISDRHPCSSPYRSWGQYEKRRFNKARHLQSQLNNLKLETAKTYLRSLSSVQKSCAPSPAADSRVAVTRSGGVNGTYVVPGFRYKANGDVRNGSAEDIRKARLVSSLKGQDVFFNGHGWRVGRTEGSIEQ